MRYVVERMTMGDIPRVVEIERLAYTTPWPPSAYRKELEENQHAYYVVLRDTDYLKHPAPDIDLGTLSAPLRRPFPLSLLPSRLAVSPEPQSGVYRRLRRHVAHAGRSSHHHHCHPSRVSQSWTGRAGAELRSSALPTKSMPSGLRWKYASPTALLRISIASTASWWSGLVAATTATITKTPTS